MSEPSDFENLHNTLRAFKKEHDVNLAVPHGVEINGKVYPATHKRIIIGTNNVSEEPFYETNFKIPLENGLVANASTTHDSLHMQLYVPTIYINGDGLKAYRHGPALHQHEDAYHASFGENKNKTDKYYRERPSRFYDEHMSLHSTRGPISAVHEVLNMWQKEPYQGTYDFDNQQGYQHFKKLRPNYDSEIKHYRPHLQLTEDELTEHRQNFKFHPEHAPHNIAVYTTNPEAPKNYNIKTEQLRPFKDVFGRPFSRDSGYS